MTRMTFTLLTVIALSSAASACGKERSTREETAVKTMAQQGDPAPATKDAEEKNQGAIKNGFEKMPAPGTPAFCPVMKNDFKVTKDTTFSVYKGKTYVFCCPGCKPQFDADPKKFIDIQS